MAALKVPCPTTRGDLDWPAENPKWACPPMCTVVQSASQLAGWTPFILRYPCANVACANAIHANIVCANAIHVNAACANAIHAHVARANAVHANIACANAIHVNVACANAIHA